MALDELDHAVLRRIAEGIERISETLDEFERVISPESPQEMTGHDAAAIRTTKREP